MKHIAKYLALIGLAAMAFFAATHAYTTPVAQLPLPTPIPTLTPLPTPTALTRPINKAALVWPKTQDECAKFGGRWGNYGRGTFFQCEISTSDWGATCTDSNQCEGECLYLRGNPPQPRRISNLP
jgi:hypothetical protein